MEFEAEFRSDFAACFIADGRMAGTAACRPYNLTIRVAAACTYIHFDITACVMALLTMTSVHQRWVVRAVFPVSIVSPVNFMDMLGRRRITLVIRRREETAGTRARCMVDGTRPHRKLCEIVAGRRT